MSFRRSRSAVFLGIAVLLCGCAVGPDFTPPQAPAVDSYTRDPLPAGIAAAGVAGGEEQRLVSDLDIPAQWWTLFRSPHLNALIEKALKNNPNVQAAEASLRQAQELLYAQQGSYYPTVQAGLTSSRQRNSATLSPTLNSGETIFNLHTTQVTVGYTLDVFGGLRRQVESLQAQADSQRFLLQASYLTLSSNVVAAAVQEAGLRAQIAAAKDIIDINKKSLELLRRQFAVGAVAGLDVAAQEAALAQAQQVLPPLQKQLEQTRNLLTALAGGFPAGGAEGSFELADLHLPEELPVSLPSKLVEQRPDVRAAEEQVHAASAAIGVAVANMLPQFTIDAAAGGSATAFGQMFASGNPFWSVSGSVTQTLFAGGALLHRKRAAEAAFDQAAAQYRSTVVGAFQNVADALYALQADADALKAAVNSERAAKVSLNLVTRQLEVGQVNYLALLSSQQIYQQAVLSLSQARANRFADSAALFQALGGGWWNRKEAAAEASSAGPGSR
jgi:NodT family efflux transporter outer membrane factor (OMF) lipoprotein